MAGERDRLVSTKAQTQRLHKALRTSSLHLVAGKGHEKYQVIGDRTLPFDDVAVARDALTRRRTKSGVAK